MTDEKCTHGRRTRCKACVSDAKYTIEAIERSLAGAKKKLEQLEKKNKPTFDPKEIVVGVDAEFRYVVEPDARWSERWIQIVSQQWTDNKFWQNREHVAGFEPKVAKKIAEALVHYADQFEEQENDE